MITASEYSRRFDLAESVALITSCVSSYFIALLIGDVIYGWFVEFESYSWVWPRLLAEARKLEQNTGDKLLTAAYVIANFACIIVVMASHIVVSLRGVSHVDFSSPRPWRLTSEGIWANAFAAVAIALFLVFYTGLASSEARFARALMESPLIMSWPLPLFGGLSSVLHNLTCGVKSRRS